MTNKETRKRSPNYPVLSLPKALERAKQLKSDKYNYIPLELLPDRWEQKSLNSYTLQIVAALSAYGLIEIQGEKSERKIRLTNDARKILSDIVVVDRDALIKKCALEPKIFKTVWEHYKDIGIPQDDVLKSDLVWGSNHFDFTFTEDAADIFINNFKETITYANLTTNDIIDDKYVVGDTMQNISTNKPIVRVDSTQHFHTADHVEPIVMKNFEIPLGNGLTAMLVVPYPLSKKKFELLKNIIKIYGEGIVSDPKKEDEEELEVEG